MTVRDLICATNGVRALDSDGKVAPSFSVPSGLIESKLEGRDVWGAGLVPVPGACTPTTNTLSLQLSPEAAVRNGTHLLQLTQHALAEDKNGKVEKLKPLIRFFPEPTLRNPVVHEFLDWYAAGHATVELARLLGVPTGARGRPTQWAEHMHAMCVIDQLTRTGMRAAEAARQARDLYPGARQYGEPRSLENLRLKLGELPRIYTEGYFIPASQLRSFRWGASPTKWTLYAPDAR